MKLEKFKVKNTKKKFIIIFTVCCILLLGGVFLYTSFAAFTEEKQFNVINGTYQDPGDIYFAYYVDGVITRDLPKQNTGYIFDEEQSNCTNGVVPTFDNSSWKFIANYSGYNATDYTRTKCNLYFKTGTKTVSTSLGNLSVYTYTPDFTMSACDDVTCESHEKGVFETTDDEGTTYYYRGSVENNYVSFAGYYWRIIRINGNGSIRMIYDGTVAHPNGESSTDRYYTTTTFNPAYTDNMYVGYMYTSGEVHGLGTSSTIKTTNDNYYASNLSAYSSYIDTNAGFCGDRSTLNGISTAGTGTTVTFYGGYLRALNGTPSLLCENTSDYYTISSSNEGNKALTYPVGLITMDEIMLAGFAGGDVNVYGKYPASSVNNYLAIGNKFYSMTPIAYHNSFYYPVYTVDIFSVTEYNGLKSLCVNNLIGLRPVINIRSNVKVSGDGTMQNPYLFAL